MRRNSSCGCLRTEQLVARTRTHGLSRHAFYRTWDNIKRRCEDPGDKEYHNYGGRGISVCPQWRRSFASFVRYIMNHLGPRPRGKSLDRIENNRGYEPGNLRWATPRQQTLNSTATAEPASGHLCRAQRLPCGHQSWRAAASSRHSPHARCGHRFAPAGGTQISIWL